MALYKYGVFTPGATFSPKSLELYSTLTKNTCFFREKTMQESPGLWIFVDNTHLDLSKDTSQKGLHKAYLFIRITQDPPMEG